MSRSLRKYKTLRQLKKNIRPASGTYSGNNRAESLKRYPLNVVTVNANVLS